VYTLCAKVPNRKTLDEHISEVQARKLTDVDKILSSAEDYSLFTTSNLESILTT
jgi:hypothetical protein